ncbi:uncharacterized protein EURHEDRAFT_410683 [Aspergillus ruber CBS 135680]|uniref:Uncharacterized protein n=1 Tax=Aspergillus ruber (strain CBS 135680) TaxID=1388766 RepID=A0A017SKP0_ASPRC|nr:uncharacterized protein EURHEDRAFT_410683 [Aspergillus ruber CBS 135680]EYE96890.1 hypothetical protein EURHEDRAFT_410683 [Aspergillus ruber CBS 135680]
MDNSRQNMKIGSGGSREVGFYSDCSIIRTGRNISGQVILCVGILFWLFRINPILSNKGEKYA